MCDQYGEFTAIQQFGSGGFGKVFLAIRGEEKKFYVLKTLNDESGKEEREILSSLHNEIKILKKLSDISNNSFIPTLYYPDSNNSKEKNLQSEKPFLAIDFFKNGNLFEYIADNPLIEKHAKVMFKKIVKYVEFCHNNKICHFDIKPTNIMLDKKFEPFIIDFGISRDLNELNEDIFKGKRSSTHYISPEMWEKKIYSGIKSDIFSLGVVLFNLVTGSYGFNKSKKNDNLYKLIINNNGDYKEYWEKTEPEKFNLVLSENFKELYVKMVAHDPKDRPTIDEILDSNWLHEINILNKDEYAILENEVRDVFLVRYEKMKEADENFECLIKKVEEIGYSTRGIKDNTKTGFFDSKLSPKKISHDRININHYITITGNLNGLDFMEWLIDKLDDTFKEDCTIEPSKEYLKFEISFDSNEENEKGESSMIIELFQFEEGGYLLEFRRTEGEIPDYYYYFLKIKKIIKELFN